ncbi:MAG: prepilin-type N-terminal cleavage/methylation domain-containing protein [Gemmatimonadetes bacterium]|nr:prepilin-type N-terminal cleavage/methylation domain-containing protein [Gemmatimonadota bacterium]
MTLSAMRSAARGHAGFTLIEVIIALFVISMTILAVGPLMTGISRGNNYGQNVSIASGRVQEKVEELKNRPFANVTNGSETLKEPAMTRRWTVVAEPVPNALKEVDVVVEWTDTMKKPQHVSVKTFIASRNPR